MIEKKMLSIEQLQKYIEFITDEGNYYAGINATLKNCALAGQLNSVLYWEEGKITNEEMHRNAETIDLAEKKAINTIKNWIINRLNESKHKLTKEDIVRSVFNVLFGF